MYKAKPKRKLKIVEKPKETPKIKIKISKEQKAKNDKTRKKILEKPKPKPKSTEPRTIGSDLTGLNKKQMNAMSMLELMGRLPKELRTQIILPSARGEEVGAIGFATTTQVGIGQGNAYHHEFIRHERTARRYGDENNSQL